MNDPVTIDVSTLKALIKEIIHEVLREEWVQIWQSVIPEISDIEQAEIDEISGLPVDYDERAFVDMTEWITGGN